MRRPSRCGDEWRGERGGALVEVPFVVVVVLLLALGAVTLTQVMVDHDRLAAAVGDGARWATRADYDPDPDPDLDHCANIRRRTIDEVKAFTAAAAGVEPEDVTVSTDPCAALPGDAITVTVRKTVDNPLYTLTAGLTNGLAGIFGGQPFPDGVTVEAEAETFAE